MQEHEMRTRRLRWRPPATRAAAGVVVAAAVTSAAAAAATTAATKKTNTITSQLAATSRRATRIRVASRAVAVATVLLISVNVVAVISPPSPTSQVDSLVPISQRPVALDTMRQESALAPKTTGTKRTNLNHLEEARKFSWQDSKDSPIELLEAITQIYSPSSNNDDHDHDDNQHSHRHSATTIIATRAEQKFDGSTPAQQNPIRLIEAIRPIVDRKATGALPLGSSSKQVNKFHSKRNYSIDNTTIEAFGLDSRPDASNSDSDEEGDDNSGGGGSVEIDDDQLPRPLEESRTPEVDGGSRSPPGGKMINSPQLLSQSQQLAQVSAAQLQLQRQSPNASITTEQSLVNPQQLAAFALRQENEKADSKLNAELCRNFSIGLQLETGGIFTSPSYPNPYPEGLTCTRLIVAPPGHYIVLEFRDQFNIEEAGADCDNDKLEIRDGHYGYSKVLARYCGNKFPPEVKSSGEAMWLRFISDASITHTGFKAVYRFERQQNAKPNPPFECRFNVTAAPIYTQVNGTESNRTGIHSGVIKNTDIPSELIKHVEIQNVSLECIWNITVMPGWKIYLTFSNYEISKPNDCDSNFIEIYEENLTEENQTVKFCGTRTEPQQSKSNVFNIRHYAISSAAHSKFEIIYTAFRDKGADGCDPKREFDCDDGTCIHESLKCDGQVNCKYRYDEAVEPGPCQSGDGEDSFFETEHMVIILIVFLTLVSGMCASIIISCWGKIQERRRRKLEYHMRKSREASMEGQLNKIDSLGNYAAGGDSTGADGNGSGELGGSGANGEMQRATRTKRSILANQSANSMDSGQQTFVGQQQPFMQQALPGNNLQFANSIGLQPNGLQRFYNTNPNSGIGAQLLAQQYQQQQQFLQQQAGQQFNGTGSGGNYGVYAPTGHNHHLLVASNSSLDTKIDGALASKADEMLAGSSAASGRNPKAISSLASLTSHATIGNNKVHDESQLQATVQQSILAKMVAHQQQQAKQQQQQSQLLRSQLAASQANSNNNNSNHNSSNNNVNSHVPSNDNNQLNSQKLYQLGSSSIAHQQHDNNPNNQSNIPVVSQPMSSGANQTSTMPINLAKYNNFLQQQQQQQPVGTIDYQAARQQQQMAAQQRAMSLSTMHRSNQANQRVQQMQQQQIYGVSVGGIGGQQQQQPVAVNQTHNFNGGMHNHLSSSITCCNALGDCALMGANLPPPPPLIDEGHAGETPLLSSLMSRAAILQQHQYQQQAQMLAGNQPTGRQLYELRSATINSRLPVGSQAFPRSISSHQLSKIQSRQFQMQQQQQQQQQQQMQSQQQPQPQVLAPQHQQHQHPLPFKSVSDAGYANRGHQPPNHSLSYPHACTGAHASDLDAAHHQQPIPFGMSRLMNQGTSSQSPALPPPPPPPNLQAGDSKRQAYKMARLEHSQLTLDTLQDSDLLNMNPMGSVQYDDQSTESDATFAGLLMNAAANQSMQNTPGALRQVRSISQAGGPIGASGKLAGQVCGQLRIATHLNECNYIRCQRSDLVADRRDQLADQTLVCDCGAFERANQQAMQLQQHQRSQQMVSMHQQQQQQRQQPPPAQMSSQPLQGSSREFDDSEEFVVQQQHVVYGSTPGNPPQQQQQRQQQQRYARFRQQSSELTGEDDDEDVDVDDVDDDEDLDDDMNNMVNNRLNHQPLLAADDDDLSSDLGPPADVKLAAQNQRQQQAYRAPRSIVRNEELRDAPIMTSKHLSGSRTSVKSCTCGSELALDRVGVNRNQEDDDEDEGDEDESSLENNNHSKSASRSGVAAADIKTQYQVQDPTRQSLASTATTTTTTTTPIGQRNKSVEANCDTITTGTATTNTNTSTTTDTPTTNTRSSGTSNTATGTTTKTALSAQVATSGGNK